ncbi:helix-turn-helix transcriptional regulator [Actinoplanes sp. NPDC023936]|uniref:helix-turn-helix domain-containing protein n=1 Tax=Actinoplanes sp. NPDC023936 TaxID=3154910 RepID=UPI0033E6EF60
MQLLGSRLRRLREACGLTQDEAAQHIRASASKISRMESGKVGTKEADLHQLLELYGISDATERLAFLGQQQRLNEPGWWKPYGNLAEWYRSYLAFESAAKYIQTYEVRLIPGILQTKAYAEAVIRSGGAGEDEVRNLLDVRLQRQRMALERGTPQVWAVVEYSSLIDGLNDKQIMREQIEFLLKASEFPHVHIQIVMPGAGGLAFRMNSFSILRLESSEVGYLEYFDRALFITDIQDLEPARAAMSELVVIAKKAAESRKIMEKILQRYR